MHGLFVCLFVCISGFTLVRLRKIHFTRTFQLVVIHIFFRPSVNNPAVPDEQVENHNSEESASFLFVVSAPNIICVLMQTSPRTLRVKTDTKDSLRAAPSDLSTC